MSLPSPKDGSKEVEQIAAYLVHEFRRENKINISQDQMAMQRIREAAKRAIVELQSQGEAEVNLPFLTADTSGPKHLRVTLGRSILERPQDFVPLASNGDAPRDQLQRRDSSSKRSGPWVESSGSGDLQKRKASGASRALLVGVAILLLALLFVLLGDSK